MSKTLVIGANGQIGKQLVKLLCAENSPVKAMIRHSQQAPFFQDLGAETMITDLDAPLPDDAFADCDKVVFTAGSGGKTGADKTILIDLWGAVKAIDMAKKHNIKQFVMVSARDAGNPEAGTEAIKHYNICKHFADEYLLASGVPYTILRPGKLINDEATGHISTQRTGQADKDVITRADVAACIQFCLKHTESINQIDELYNGDETIQDAFINSVSGRLG